jgi:hypothetical protein
VWLYVGRRLLMAVLVVAVSMLFLGLLVHLVPATR